MKLFHNAFYEPINIDENEHLVIVVENQKLLFTLCNDLINQSKELEWNYVLSNKNEELTLSKNVEFVYNVLNIDFNDKRIINKIIKDLEALSINEEYHSNTRKLVAEIEKHFSNIALSSNYSIELDEPEITSLIKSLNPKIEFEGKSLLDTITEYVKLISSITGKKIFIFLNLKTLLSKEDINELYKFADYEKLNFILFEATIIDKYDIEKYIIIDKDMCII